MQVGERRAWHACSRTKTARVRGEKKTPARGWWMTSVDGRQECGRRMRRRVQPCSACGRGRGGVDTKFVRGGAR